METGQIEEEEDEKWKRRRRKQGWDKVRREHETRRGEDEMS